MQGRSSRFVLASALAFALGACSTTTSSSPASEAASENDVPVSCAPDAPRYHAFLASPACADVEGVRGHWTAAHLFPNAPATIRDRACTYRWAPVGDAPPDVPAPHAPAPELLTKSIEETPPCDAPALSPEAVTLTPVAPTAGDDVPTGVTGCDVCAHVVERQVFAILPAEDIDMRTLTVTTTAGKMQTFALSASPQVFSVELPPPPTGEGYVARVTLRKAP